MLLYMSETINFGKALKQAREEKGLTRVNLASLLKVQYYNISDWETGRSQPKFDILIQICKALDTTPNELLGFDL